MSLRALCAGACLAAAAIVLLLSSRAVSAGPEISSGRILITLDSEPCCQLIVFDSSGMHAIPAGPLDPSLDQSSWAGRDAVVFTSERGGDGVRHVYEMPVTGGTAKRIAVGGRGLSQEWPSSSVDGTRIVFTEVAPGTGLDRGVFIAQTDGTWTRRIALPSHTAPDSGWGEPEFTPGRGDVLVSRIFDRRSGLSSVTLLPDRQSCEVCPGSRVTLTPPALDAGYPRAAPTGHAILFSQSLHTSRAHGPGAGPLWLLAGPNGPARPLTHHPAGTWSYEGNWSPDGTQIVYLYYRPGWNHNQLRIVNADGSGDHALWAAPAGTYAAMPDWGP